MRLTQIYPTPKAGSDAEVTVINQCKARALDVLNVHIDDCIEGQSSLRTVSLSQQFTVHGYDNNRHLFHEIHRRGHIMATLYIVLITI